MVQQEVRQSHPYFMYDSIHQQPSAMTAMLERHGQGAKEIASLLGQKRRIYLVGIGTSWHAALTAEHWFRHFAAGQPEVQAWHSFEFASYPPPLGPDDAAIIISHRGTKTYSFESLNVARARGALTLAVTSTDPGPRIMEANIKLHTVEPERSAAFTVSYTSAMAVAGPAGKRVRSFPWCVYPDCRAGRATESALFDAGCAGPPGGAGKSGGALSRPGPLSVYRVGAQHCFGL